MNSNPACRISQVEITNDTLTSRGGIALFVKYLEAIDIISLLLAKFGSLKKSRKGVTLQNLFLQVLCFFASSGIFREIFIGCFSGRLQRKALGNEINRAGRRLLSLSSRCPAVKSAAAQFWLVFKGITAPSPVWLNQNLPEDPGRT